MIDVFEVDQEKRYLRFDFDTLAYVLDQEKSGKPSYEIGSRLVDIINRDKIEAVAVSAESQQEADAIRKYYRNKLLVHSLQGNKLSKFRISLQEIVADSRNIEVDAIGPLVSLSRFYEEDQIIDSLIRSELITEPGEYRRTVFVDKELNLEYVTKLYRKTQKMDKICYFFKNSDNHLFGVKLDRLHPCVNLFERELEKTQVKIKATGSGTSTIGTNLGYVHLSNWNLII